MWGGVVMLQLDKCNLKELECNKKAPQLFLIPFSVTSKMASVNEHLHDSKPPQLFKSNQ